MGAIASALAHVGLKAHSRVGVYGMNAPEWMVAMQVESRNSVRFSSTWTVNRRF